MDTIQIKRRNLKWVFLYASLFILGIKTLFHGFPDIERFFAEWMNEGVTLTYIMKFGTLNFAPTQIIHPPLYHYLTFIPIGIFFVIGKLLGIFQDKIEFVRFYFNNTHYFFLIGRTMAYTFYWLTGMMIFKIVRLFYSRYVAHITVFTFLLVPYFISDFSTMRLETLLFLNTSLFLYCFLKYYLDDKRTKYLCFCAFLLGVSVATKYNALILGVIFVPLLIERLVKKGLTYENFKITLALCLKIGFFVFFGFFICNPFFVIKYKTYLHNLILFDTVQTQYYDTGYWPAIFVITRIKDLSSMLYLNFFGSLIFILGCWKLLRKDRKLSLFLFLTILIFEIYFGLYHRNTSPTYFLNPLLPIILLIFAVGVDFILGFKKRLMPILVMFFLIITFKHFNILAAYSLVPTYTQEARAFIEQNIPDLTNICIASDNYLPQLNLTRKSYYHLIRTPSRKFKNDKLHPLNYKKMDYEVDNEDILRELRIESLTKKPQYNLIRWDINIRSEEEAIKFFKKNKIEYLITSNPRMIGKRKIEDTDLVYLVKTFKPNIKIIYPDVDLNLYKINK